MTSATHDKLLEKIRVIARGIGRPIRLMEICGTHTHAIGRGGLRALMPANVQLISGPGCPVCVTAQRDVERMMALARQPGLTVCTFGDMLRVPGNNACLEEARSLGADVRVVYSPLDALDLARKEPRRNVAFLSVGFETTSPGVASMVLQAREQGVYNLSLYVCHKLLLPAMEALLAEGSAIDGFLTPGHVTVIIGVEAYEALSSRHGIPCVATGFEPADVLQGIAILLECIAEKRSGSLVQYTRAIRPGGNRKAWATLMRVFEPAESEWRGMGCIGGSGLRLRDEFSEFDAARKYDLPDVQSAQRDGCHCGEVLRGLVSPPECPMFKKACSPANPLGPCMVSSEGACAARYRYG